jgi:phytoene synthase
MQPELRAEDFAACQAILREGSKTFSLASLLLPRRVRVPATVVYAFCRVADDRIDCDPEATEAAVDELRDRLYRLVLRQPEDNPVDRALGAVMRSARLPIEPLDALLEGLAWDAAGRRYENVDDLYGYAARVAGTVGVTMAILMGQRSATVLARACDLGVAMQLTNIARDVGEDAARGRIYLPLQWMREAGLDPDAWLTRPVADDATRSVVSRLLGAASELYARADVGVPALPADCRTAIRAARLIYSDIGRSIQNAGFDSVTRRASVPLGRKLWLLLRAFGGGTPLPLAIDAPPLGPTRFLVAACSEAP